MKYKQTNNKVAVRIDKGEEIVETIKKLCKNLGIKTGTITGIGATNKCIIGFLNTKTQKYQSKEFIGDHEIAPLIGNISTMNGDVYLHLHINICNAEQKSFGGHLNSAIVSVTFEAIIDIIDGEINRIFDETIGVNLMDI